MTGGNGGRILIVDDDPDAGELAARRLESTGAVVDFHHGPFGTMTAIRSGEYDVVLLDVNMPALTGPQIMELLGRDPVSAKTVLFSSSDEEHLRDLASTSGAAGYVSKSASKAALLAAVSPLLPGGAPPP